MKSKKNIIIAALAILVIAGSIGYSQLQSSTTLEANSADAVVITKKQDVLNEKTGDYFLGNTNAPVVLIEYASLSCPHCAQLHDKVIEPLIESHVNTGKVKYIYRDFPLNEPALKASMLARCFGKTRYFSLLKALFITQQNWVNENYKEELRKVVKPIGVDDAQFETCINNKETEEQILLNLKEGSEVLGVESTPTVFINGLEYTGDRNYNSIVEYINSLSGGGH